MTDNLVKRLRDKNCCDATKCNCDEAADRIEQLEAALWQIIEDQVQINRDEIWIHKNIARAALGEKKDAD